LTALFEKFRFLKPALILILAFDGERLLLLSVPPYLTVFGMTKADPIKIDTTVSLLVVVSTLALATVLSVVIPAKTPAKGGEQTKRLWQAGGKLREGLGDERGSGVRRARRARWLRRVRWAWGRPRGHALRQSRQTRDQPAPPYYSS